MNPLIQLKTTPPLLITLALLCFGILPNAQAVVPAPDGGYPGGNTAEGDNALLSLTTGINNTAVGANALRDNTTGAYNVAIGEAALANNTSGFQNMAIGAEALGNNNANFNLAIGFRALFMNTTGNHLTGIGAAALRNNTTASDNTAIGSNALRENTIGAENTAIGSLTLPNNTIGNFNTASGYQALFSNTTGVYNTANGYQALPNNTTGDLNTAIGVGALFYNTTGNYNTAIGSDALHYNTRGSNNIGLGNDTGISVTTASNVICIGRLVLGANVSNTCFIGNIREVATINMNAIPVVIDSSGQLGTMSSSKRYKHEIKPMETASEAILALKPVTFHYKSDKTDTPQFGLIAEEVAEVNPDLILRDNKGDVYSVRYDAVNAMLLNEFLKEHKTVQKLKATVMQQQENFQSKLAQQQKQIEALTAGLQKVSAQLAAASPSGGGFEASKFATGRIRGGGPAPQVVNNP